MNLEKFQNKNPKYLRRTLFNHHWRPLIQKERNIQISDTAVFPSKASYINVASLSLSMLNKTFTAASLSVCHLRLLSLSVSNSLCMLSVSVSNSLCLWASFTQDICPTHCCPWRQVIITSPTVDQHHSLEDRKSALHFSFEILSPLHSFYSYVHIYGWHCPGRIFFQIVVTFFSTSIAV